MAEQELEQREITFSGRVQGVGFRYTAQSLARRFAITGFVRNLRDGRVQLVAEGEPDEINRYLVALRRELGDYIADQSEIVRPVSKAFQHFEIRF